jgi:hypothetical protein
MKPKSLARLSRFFALLTVVASVAPVMAAPSGSYQGTLTCKASLVTPTDAAFNVPVTLKVEGSTLTWTREAAGTREVVSSSMDGDRASLDGYGGNISPGTHQAFWDWKIKGQLAYANNAFTGDVELLSKDGRTLQRHCKLTTKGAASGPTLTASVPAQALAAPSTPVLPAGGADQAAELRRREEALAARERALAQREQQLASVPSTPSATTATTVPAPTAAPAPAPSSPAPTTAASAANVIAATPAQGNPPVAAPARNVAAGAGVVLGALADAAVRRSGSSSSSWVRMNAAPLNETAHTAIAMESGPLRAAPTPWATKQSFLAATREGTFLVMAQLTESSQEGDPLVNTVSNILGSEYQVPQLPRQAQGCTLQYRSNVMQLFTAITQREASTLSDEPPSFRQASHLDGPSPEYLAQRITASPNCDLEGMGMHQAHPYKQALMQLGAEYAQATRAYVGAEADRRMAAFSEHQAQVAAEAKRQRDLAEQARRGSRSFAPSTAQAVAPATSHAPSTPKPTAPAAPRAAAAPAQGDI